jgi:aminoglycoside phosphotransferase (APT) family kinase protein
MATTAAKRDSDATRQVLEAWLDSRLSVSGVTVSDLSVPKAGFSNETIFGRAQWSDSHGTAHDRGFVLRIEPSTHQLFVEPDAIRQARVMEHLAGHVPAPTIWLTEPDATVLGAPFFLMDRVDGRIPSDVPSWHRKGWATELSAAQRAELYNNALDTLAALHQVDWRKEMGFLEPAGEGTALDKYLAHVERWYRWCEPVRRFGTDVIDAALSYLSDNRPDTGAAALVWGDARPGNIIFANDLSVAAMLDWEGATVGPPEIDVGWWIMFEEFLSEAQGAVRLEGIASQEGIIARYQERSGHSLESITYYQILAGLVFALINSRLADLLIRQGTDPDFAAEFVTRVTGMTGRWLAEV